MTARRGRGQPPALTPDRQAALCALVAAGATLTDAATKTGVARSTLHNTRHRDPQFAAALEQALTAARCAATNAPCCTACRSAALTLTATGAQCPACHTQYQLVPAQYRPTAVPALTPPLAHAS